MILLPILLEIVVILLGAAFIVWLISVLFPGDNRYKTAALGVISLIVIILVLTLLWPPLVALIHATPHAKVRA